MTLLRESLEQFYMLLLEFHATLSICSNISRIETVHKELVLWGVLR